MDKERGRYIVFEGGDHTGKSTQASLLSKYLRYLGKNVTETKEPGGTRIGRDIRRLLIDPDNKGMDEKTELFLFAADRAEVHREIIIPSLGRGDWVISDRNYFSNEAYQKYGKGLDLEIIKEINNYATGGLKPDLAFIINAPERILDQKKEHDRIESLGQEFHERVRQGYLEIADQNKDICVLIERDKRTIEDIQEEVRSHVNKRFGL